MTWSDEELMAYADGELDAARRAAVEQAMREDPAVAAAVERHRALRADVFGAFAGVLDEPVPERLVPRASTAAVLPLDAARAARAQARRRWTWPEWGAMAASLALGVLAGAAGWHTMSADGGATLASANGTVVARGALADALTDAVAGRDEHGVRIGVSFRSKNGEYCRSFVSGSAAGLACRTAEGWRIPVLAEGAEQGTAYRQAGASLPPAVLDAIDARIEGSALDAQGEAAARARGWR